MVSRIEQSIYQDRGIHGVSMFVLAPGVVRLQLTPWEGAQISTIAPFSEARIVSVDSIAADPEELELPWDVIGFDSYELGDKRWQFVLCCQGVEWCFESTWPALERTDNASNRLP